MGAWTIPGPVIDRDNQILRSARLVSESDKTRSIVNYHRIRVGIREGDYVSYVGTWDQSSNKINKGKERRILASKNRNKRLRKGQQIVIDMLGVGSPSTPSDMAITLRFALDGSRTGRRRPLVHIGSGETARRQIKTLVDRINEAGLNEWDLRIQITDEPS